MPADTAVNPVELDREYRRQVIGKLKDIADDLEIAGLEDLPVYGELREAIVRLFAQAG